MTMIGVQKDGHMFTNLAPDQRLVRDSTLVSLGTAEQRARFSAVYD